MPKIKLKRTSEEEERHQARKERKRQKKRKREDDQSNSSKRQHHDADPPRKWASSDEEEYIPQPTSFQNIDYDALQAEIEEGRFRQKMFDALGDDERLDGLETRFNDFAHVPDRWRSSEASGFGKTSAAHDEDYSKMDPNVMDDEEYAEWIRIGMYRKTHAEEYAEQQRQKAEHAARKTEEKGRKEEKKRLEKQAEEERERKETARSQQRLQQAREEYGVRWQTLLASVGNIWSENELAFLDIPWPVVEAYRRRPPKDGLKADDFTLEAISTFLLGDTEKKERRVKLREAMRLYHPDKFEGRFMIRVKREDQKMVLEGIGQVSRILNSLIAQ